uniref:Uncharacterized protein n=1 Tax=Chromera velia CCMP2878 TaxID=1169474 RepID=A0A0G4H8A6_9ALVE|eukprot:Cvel_865.t1-p1 / transcript=Cvel_865.t1 / gene=Cvel_865 / organism=Chromera_velia_CCMP2878 / gene_product=hypothetical protein / transcript_product=hypothetical protein / location=Cvel_scaffold27:59713-60762(+) / protein_length=350 / sequence_SO=supercontig / SO=protein_coding / is_pseudo=false
MARERAEDWWKEWTWVTSRGLVAVSGSSTVEGERPRCCLIQQQLATGQGVHMILQGTFFRWVGFMSAEAFFFGLRTIGIPMRLGGLELKPTKRELSPFYAVRPVDSHAICMGESGVVLPWEFVVGGTGGEGGRLAFGAKSTEALEENLKVQRKDGSFAVVKGGLIQGRWLESDRVRVTVLMGVSLQKSDGDSLLPFPCSSQRAVDFPPLHVKKNFYFIERRDPKYLNLPTSSVVFFRTEGWASQHGGPLPERQKRAKRARIEGVEAEAPSSSPAAAASSSSSSFSSSSSSSFSSSSSTGATAALPVEQRAPGGQEEREEEEVESLAEREEAQRIHDEIFFPGGPEACSEA